MAVADGGGYASLKLLDRCRKLSGSRSPSSPACAWTLPSTTSRHRHVVVVGQIGRPRLKGERLANLSVVAEDPDAGWEPITTIGGWYGCQQRVVEVLSGRALWYSTGLPAVPLRGGY